MANYIKKDSTGEKQNVSERIVEKQTINKSENIDVKALAQEIAKSISGNNFVINHDSKRTNQQDNFDDSGTMSNLAEQMLVQRGDSKSNFDNLGNVKETTKNEKDVDQTIDLLSNIDD